MKFTEELDIISQKQWSNIFKSIKDNEYIKNIRNLQILIEANDILEKYELDKKIEFILDIGVNGTKMKYFYDGSQIKPEGKWLGVTRQASILEILKECTIQKKAYPDIAHLQTNSFENIREDKLNNLFKQQKDSILIYM